MRISSTQMQTMRYKPSSQTPSTKLSTRFSGLLVTAGKTNADTFTKQVSPASQSGSLSSDDIRFLSSEFDPENMTQSQYDKLLEFLNDKGVLTKDEMISVGYHGMLSVSASLSSYSMPEDAAASLKEAETEGNMCKIISSMARMTDYRNARGEPDYDTEKNVRLYKKITNILNQIM